MRGYFVYLLIPLFLSLLEGEELINEKISKEFLTELSGEIAKEHVLNISMFDRIQASEGWDLAAEYIVKKLKEYGIEYGIDSYPSDGEIRYYTWPTPLGWRVKDGELWLVEPVTKRIACFRDVPSSLVKHSCSANLKRAEVIYVKEGANPSSYKGIDVKGKIILSQSYAGNVHREAVIKRGALGVITFLPFHERDDYPDLIPYQALWPKKSEIGKVGFGFTISRKIAREIISYIESGKKVYARASVSAELYPSDVKTLWAIIKGGEKPDEEIILLAHLDHYKPGAIDNASGSAGLLEIARTFKKLIDEKKIPAPKRTIRFLWLNEWYSTAPYLKSHPEVSKKALVALNLDMIGGNPQILRNFLTVTKTPHSIPSFINDLVEISLEKTSSLQIESATGAKFPFFFRMTEYSGGSDHHFFNDSTIAVSSLMFNHPDPYWHTIQDTPDHVDTTEMKRVIFTVANVIFFLTNPDLTGIKLFYQACLSRSLKRAGESLKNQLTKIYGSKDEESFNKNVNMGERVLKYTFERERKALSSIKRIDGRIASWLEKKLKEFDSSKELIQKSFKDELNDIALNNSWKIKKISLSSEEKELESIIPARAEDFRLPLRADYLDEVLGEGTSRNLPLKDPILYEMINFIDGRRSLLEIYERLVEEFGDLDIKSINTTIEILSNAKLIKIKKK
ncbi:MAG: M28 family peptidase [Candidatus Aminicenantia bacterium]